MAEEIVFKVGVDAQGAQQTLGGLKTKADDLRQAIEGKPIGSKEFNELRSELIRTEQQLELVEEGLKGLGGVKFSENIEKIGTGIAGAFSVATGAVGVFGDQLGLSAEQVAEAQEKANSFVAIMVGLKPAIEGAAFATKLFNTVLKANPLFIVGGAVAAAVVTVIGLFKNMDSIVQALTESFGVLGEIAFQVLDFITLGYASQVKAINEAKKAEEDRIKALQKQNAEIIDGYDKQIKAVQKLRAEEEKGFDKQIRLAKAAGKETALIERQKLENTVNRIRQELELEKKKFDFALEQAAKLLGLDKQRTLLLARENPAFRKQVEAQEELIKGLTDALSEAELSLDEFVLQQGVKYAEQLKKKQEEFEEFARSITRVAKKERESRVISELQTEQQVFDKRKILFEESLRLSQEQFQKEAELEQERLDNKLAVNDAIAFATAGLFETLGALAQNNAKVAEDLALAQVIFDQGVAIANALAVAFSPADPANQLTGGIAGIVKYATLFGVITSSIGKVISQIKSRQNASGGSIIGAGGGGGFNTGNAALPTSFNQQSQNLDRDRIDSGNAQSDVRVFVTETDISKTQKNVNGVVRRATVR